MEKGLTKTLKESEGMETRVFHVVQLCESTSQDVANGLHLYYILSI